MEDHYEGDVGYSIQAVISKKLTERKRRND